MRRTAATAIAAATLALAACTSPSGTKPSATASVTTTQAPAAAVTVSPACRAWIAGELQDASESIDATAGHTACGDLTEAEFDQAVDEVTGELLASAAAQ